MRGRDLALFTVLASLIMLPALAVAQQPPPPWPAPAGAQQPPAAGPDTQAAPDQQPPPPPKKKKNAKKKTPPPQETPDPRFEEEPGPPGAGPTPAPKRPKAAAANALDIKCDGAFAKNTTFANLVKVFGPRNVFSQPGGVTLIFQSDPKRRIEVTWRDVVGRIRPAMILVEGQSTWRVRGFRLGDAMAEVEKVNGKPFRLDGFGAIPGGNARDWQGGKLDKLPGGCQLGIRFAPAAGTPQDVLSRITIGGNFMSDDPDIRAANPTIIELLVGYPE